MRIFVVTLAILAAFATAARAGDDSPLAGKLPDTAGYLSVYLFTLKKSGISLPMSPQEFCSKMDYGEAVLGQRTDEVVEDHKVAPGKLDWVICRFKGK